MPVKAMPSAMYSHNALSLKSKYTSNATAVKTSIVSVALCRIVFMLEQGVNKWCYAAAAPEYQ